MPIERYTGGALRLCSHEAPEFVSPTRSTTVAPGGLRSYAKNGPSALRGSFKLLASAYDTFAKTDFSNPTALSQLSTLGTTYAKDLQKIAAYFAKQCNFTVPTAGSETIPSIPTS
jgi:hypothetical protein